MNRITCFTLASLAAGVMMYQSKCNAVIYDAAADFTMASNPNGVWSYGYSTAPGGSVTLDGEAYASGGIYHWRRTGTGENGPLFSYNPTDSPITLTGPSDLITWNAHQLATSPGSANWEFSVLRFTVPGTSLYQVHGVFSSVDKWYGATTDVHIMRNGISIYDGVVQGITSIQSFDQTIQLNAGDLLDYVVGVDGYAGGWDGTGLDATVTPVPEPSVVSLLMLGLPLAGRVCYRHKAS